MLTNKEKRYLKALGAKLEPVVQVGKAGVAPAVVDGAAGVIEGRELIKVRVLKNSPEEPAEAIARLAEGVGAELVQVIGRNGLLFKRNAEKPKIVFSASGAASASAVKAPPAGKAKPAEGKAATPKPRGAAKPAGRPAASGGEKPAGPRTPRSAPAQSLERARKDREGLRAQTAGSRQTDTRAEKGWEREACLPGRAWARPSGSSSKWVQVR